MNRLQRRALRILLGNEAAQIIEAWCRAIQVDNPVKWIWDMLLGEIHECWSENVSEFPGLKLRDKLILDRFVGIGAFREHILIEAPTLCPDCQGQVLPGEQINCPIDGELRQTFECCSCNYQTSISCVNLETHPERV
jgi:hypothetical protein